MTDNVNKPKHYNQGKVECIDAIEAMLGREGFIAYCQGNAMKYLWRHQYKGKAIEDLKKAEWYQNKILVLLRDKPAAQKPGDVSDIEPNTGWPTAHFRTIYRGG